jgi:hypothetical protein
MPLASPAMPKLVKSLADTCSKPNRNRLLDADHTAQHLNPALVGLRFGTVVEPLIEGCCVDIKNKNLIEDVDELLEIA